MRLKVCDQYKTYIIFLLISLHLRFSIIADGMQVYLELLKSVIKYIYSK